MAAATEPGAPRTAESAGLKLTAIVGAGLTLVLGAVECWYGKTDSGDVFGSDAVQYLDCARALGRGDWHSALNPLWSQGYPAVLAVLRPLFTAGPWGDWLDTRAANLLIFLTAGAAFAWLLLEMNALRRWKVSGLAIAVAAFITCQLLIDQASRTGPDQLLAALFLLACALLLRLRRRPSLALACGLGVVLGAGFLAKAVFLLLGCVTLAVAVLALRRKRGVLLAAAGIFGAIVLSYGAALSHATGHRTLGESGSLNYAWHVNRLAKWVHWEGGAEPAAQAWPKLAIARFAHWQDDPPDFGKPLHPSVMLGPAPVVYSFHERVQATYIPYYDPAWFYTGYRHVFRWRYQVIALAKNSADLMQVLLRQPMVYALFLLVVWLLSESTRRKRLRNMFATVWPVILVSLAGIAVYLPVHLEGRYLAPFLLVLATVLAGVPDWCQPGARWLLALILLAFAVGLVREQRAVWARPLHGWSPRSNPEWQDAEAILASGLGANAGQGSEVGVISWTPNLHCDWAYLSGVRITSEIASGPDQQLFWALPASAQAKVLARFQQAGARAVLTQDPPPAGASGWQQLAASRQPVRMWMYRLP